MTLTCPQCKATTIKKNGSIHTGKQKYECLACHRQFVENPQNKQIPGETKERVQRALLERVSLEGICRLSCKIHGEYREGKIPLAQRNRRLGARKQRAEYWLGDGLANGSDALAKICGTLLEDFDKLWTFTRILGMEPTNNMAESDLRKLVIWRRKSYGTRSSRGKKFVERVTTVAQTIRKQSGNVLHFIQKAIECLYSQVLPPLISEAMGF